MKPVRIFTSVWGEQHIHFLERGLLESVQWPRNLEALESNVVAWNIATSPQDVDRIRELFAKTPFKAEITSMNVGVCPGDAVLLALTDAMRTCVLEDTLFMTSFSDIVFGEGTLETMLSLAQRKHLCVSVPHMRVLPNILNHLDRPLTNPQLVTLALQNAHTTWTEAQIGIQGFIRPHSNQFYGGLSWEKIGSNYIVQHVLPSVWIANVRQDDVEFLKNGGGMGAYDHNWPTKLCNEGRSRVIGASDAAFMVEITPEDRNRCPLSIIDQEWPDKFHHDKKHHDVYRTFYSVFREG